MGVIHVVGLGPGDFEGLPMGTFNLLKQRYETILRTRIHPVVNYLETELGTTFSSFDEIYEKGEAFAQIYQEMAERLLAKAVETDHIIYAVPGHPLVAEQSVQHLLDADTPNVEVVIGPGQSFFDVACAKLRIDPIDGLMMLDATTLTDRTLNPCVHTLIAQIYQPSIATEVKLTLMTLFPDDYAVTVLRAAGVAGEERIEQIPLFELDRLSYIDHLTTLYVPPVKEQAGRVRDLWESVDIVKRLREPDGCPWDRKQTHESLRKYVIEEAYEVAEAIDEGDTDHLAEELGDLILQVLLHAQIADEFGEFSIRDIFGNLAEKLLRRHPHVFGETIATNVSQANAVWESVKQNETGKLERETKVLDGVMRAGPALMVATEVQKAAAKVGFDWNQVREVLDKIKEEMNELEAEFEVEVESIESSSSDAVIEELGDLIFACVNLSRFLGLDAEAILAKSTTKFVERFSGVEAQVIESARDWADFAPDELDTLWKRAKIAQRHKN